MKAKALFNPQQKAAIETAISQAERNTSGELRLYIEDHSADDVLDRAAFIFNRLKMQETGLRNGVLIYMAVADQKFAILGDAGINAAVPDDFWENIKENMGTAFRKGDIEQGLITGILAAGKALAEHFPFNGQTDTNELPNDIIIG
ncbi:MAG: TPM domain-containing protein [Flavobacteriales bacterium]|nr:TPM domain-containing protein [Flavobacteriales bacterium]